MMQTLLLEPGDLLQTKSTDLPPGQFIKLQPQDTNFLDISDPKAVLETAFRNFSCLSEGDIFTFLYNETTYEIAVLEVKPKGDKKSVSVQETDIEVDFAPPVGYVEPSRTAVSGTSTPRSIGSTMAGKGGTQRVPWHKQSTTPRSRHPPPPQQTARQRPLPTLLVADSAS
jgi:ubiquitin fusion degradation protein 1